MPVIIMGVPLYLVKRVLPLYDQSLIRFQSLTDINVTLMAYYDVIYSKKNVFLYLLIVFESRYHNK